MVSDDIVTRLRVIEAQVQRTLPDYLVGFPSVHAEAADEIERLRAEIDEAKKWAKVYAEMYAHLESQILKITEIVKYFDTKYEVTRDE